MTVTERTMAEPGCEPPGPSDLRPAAVQPLRGYIWGYDVMRLCAVGVVAARHLLAVSGEDNTVISYWLGVPVFATLSGFLALRHTGGAAQWLGRRLEKIIVPYW